MFNICILIKYRRFVFYMNVYSALSNFLNREEVITVLGMTRPKIGTTIIFRFEAPDAKITTCSNAYIYIILLYTMYILSLYFYPDLKAFDRVNVENSIHIRT